MSNLNSFKLEPSQGGHYFCGKLKPSLRYIKEHGDNLDEVISNKILDQTNIHTVPGSAFNQPGYLRFSKLENYSQYSLGKLREILMSLSL